jgi:hypothetical protein
MKSFTTTFSGEGSVPSTQHRIQIGIDPEPQIRSDNDFLGAIHEGVQDALWRHRQLGETVVGSDENGNLVKLTGDEIPVDEETIRRNEARRRSETTH